MTRFILFFTIVYSSLIAKAQVTPCYFLRDTGTIETETSSSVVELSDGTSYVAGTQGNGPFGKDDIALLKLDACGNVLWIKYYGDTLVNNGLYINKTVDEKLIMVGQTGTIANGSDAFFYILDTSGTILFQQLYGDPLEQSVKYVEQTSDKGFVFCGYTTDAFGSNDMYGVKIDSSGIIQWQIQVGGNLTDYADQIHELADSNYLMTGDTKSYGNGGYDVEVVKINKNGNIIWNKTYGDHLNNGCQGIIEMSNGKYLSFGETEITGSVIFDFFIEMIDTNGAAISRHTFGGPAADALFSLVEVPGMEFICTGYSRSYNGFAAYDVVLFKVDTAGQMKWLKNIASPGIDIGYKIIPSINGGYLITGLFADNNDNYFLIHTDTIPNTSVGLNSSSDKNKIALYPNPCNDLFYVDMPGSSGNYTLEITNIVGQKIKTIELHDEKTKVEVGNLLPGIYTVSITDGNKNLIVKKLLINSK